jgi:NAD(P)H-nitrite reductase large subunit
MNLTFASYVLAVGSSHRTRSPPADATRRNRALLRRQIATGSEAGMPPYCSVERGRKTQGVFVYRNIADLEKIIAYAGQDTVQRATVVGGGLLGLEAAKALYDMEEISDVS